MKSIFDNDYEVAKYWGVDDIYYPTCEEEEPEELDAYGN